MGGPEAKKAFNATGATLLARTIAVCGIEYVFMERHSATDFIARAIQDTDGLRLIQPVSETACVPMADACARYTGKPVVSLTTGGGHCLNQVMGVTTAWGDKSPVITIGVFQETEFAASPVFDREAVDLGKVFAPVCVYHTVVNHVRDLAPAVRRAARETVSGRGGTAHIRVSLSLLESQPAEAHPAATPASPDQGQSPRPCPPMAEPEQLRRVFELLRTAQRPFIFAGGGIIRAGAADLLNRLAEKARMPVLSSMGALDVVDPGNPMYIGPSSYLAGEAFHTAIKEADVVLAVGACFSGLDGFGLPPLWSKKIKFIQVNIDHQFIALNPGADIAVVADAKHFLAQLLDLVEKSPSLPDWSDWIGRLKRKNRQHLRRLEKEARGHRSSDGKFHPAAGLLAVRDYIEEADVIAVVDGGNTPLWAGMTIRLKGPRRVFFPTGMATLGVGVPMALGLKAAAPDKPVLLLTGDGSLLYNIQELELMKRYGLPLIIVVNNDSAWNMIRAGEVMLNRPVSTELPEQNYADVAAAFGITVKRVTRLEEVPGLIRDAVGADHPVLIDIPTDKNVYPDALASFIRVEFMGSLFPQPFKKIRQLHRSQINPFSRNTWNMVKFLFKTL